MSDYKTEPDMEDEEYEEEESSEENQKESKKAVFTNLRHDYKKAKDAKTLIDKEITGWNEIYYGETEESTNKQKSQMVMKEVAKMIEWQKPNITEPFVAPSRPIKVTGRDSIMSRIASKYLNEEFTRHFGRQKFIEDIADVLSREGTVWVRTSWNYREEIKKETLEGIFPEEALELEKISNMKVNEDGTINVDHEYTEIVENNPYAEVCRNEHIFPDPSARTEDEMQFLCYRKEMTLSQLRETGLYDEKKLASLKGKILNREDDTSLGQARNVDARISGYDTTYQSKDIARQKVDVIEYWGYYDLNGDGIAEPIIAVWVDKFDCDLRLEENPFPQKKIPFHRQVYSSKPFSLWGNALAYFIGDLQRIKSGMVRGILDNMSLANNGQKFVQRGALDYVNFKRMNNGERHIIVNKANSIEDGSYNQLPQSVFQTLQMVNTESQQLSGLDGDTLNSANGNKADGEYTPTTTSQQRMSDTVRKMSELLDNVFQDWISMANMFMTNEQIEDLFDDQEEAYLDAFDGKFEITVSTGTETNKQNQIKELNMLMQQSATLSENAPPKIMNMMVADMYDIMDKPDLATMLREYEPQPSPQQTQMQQMQLEEQVLKNQLLQAQIQKTMMDGQSGAIKAEASMVGAGNGRINSQSKASVDSAKAQETRVNTALKPAETLANLTQGNANGSKPEGT